MEISVVIYLYNDKDRVYKIYNALADVLSYQTQDEYEILFINDGGGESCFTEISDIQEQDTRVRQMGYVGRHFGRKVATVDGLTFVSGEAVLLMTGDLEQLPFILPQMVEVYRAGYDVVSGHCTHTGESNLKVFKGKQFYTLMNHFLDKQVPEGVAEFLLCSREVVIISLAGKI